MEAALGLQIYIYIYTMEDIYTMNSAHRFGLYKSAAGPRLLANHSHPSS